MNMKGIIAMVGMNVGGAIGWWLGSFVGMGTAVLLAAVGTGVGLYAIRKLAERYLE